MKKLKTRKSIRSFLKENLFIKTDKEKLEEILNWYTVEFWRDDRKVNWNKPTTYSQAEYLYCLIDNSKKKQYGTPWTYIGKAQNSGRKKANPYRRLEKWFPYDEIYVRPILNTQCGCQYACDCDREYDIALYERQMINSKLPNYYNFEDNIYRIAKSRRELFEQYMVEFDIDYAMDYGYDPEFWTLDDIAEARRKKFENAVSPRSNLCDIPNGWSNRWYE